MSKPFYITTPIYYVNAEPHLGHAYTTIVADVLNRFHTLAGLKSFFLTGTDEHGDKIAEAAEKTGQSPSEYVDRMSALFRNLWPKLNISNDYFVRTTDQAHQETVKQILGIVKDKGDIYFSDYEGLYCFGCERFYTEKELVEGKCPDHQTEPQIIKESNYFFRMSKYIVKIPLSVKCDKCLNFYGKFYSSVFFKRFRTHFFVSREFYLSNFQLPTTSGFY